MSDGIKLSEVKTKIVGLYKMFGGIKVDWKINKIPNTDECILTGVCDVTQDLSIKLINHIADYNRDLTDNHSFVLSEEFKKEPIFTTVPLIITNDLKIIDGQGRLHAVRESGVTMRFCFNVGASKKAYKAIDLVRTRSLADRTNLGKDIKGALKTKITFLISYILNAQKTKGKKKRVVGCDVEAYFSQHSKELEEVCYPFICNSKEIRGMNKSFIIACFYDMYLFNPSKAKEFSELVRTRCSKLAPQDFNSKHPCVLLYGLLTDRRSMSRVWHPQDIRGAIYWTMKKFLETGHKPVSQLSKLGIEQCNFIQKEEVKEKND